MIRTLFNDGWKVLKGERDTLVLWYNGYPEGKDVTLPHDAMIEETQDPAGENKGRTGNYPGGFYRYVKRFHVPEEWRGKTVTVEFEGVYRNSLVYLNGDFIGNNYNGYTNFYVNLDSAILYGEENELEVLVNNTAEPNSRWYSGSGIYRNVNLILGNPVHIATDSLRITTPEIDAEIAAVLVEAKLENRDNKNCQALMETKIYDDTDRLVSEESNPVTVFRGTDSYVSQRLTVAAPKLWSCETPNLYRCEVRLLQGEEVIDTEICHFGIRRLSLDGVRGLRINGEEVKLRGACIHHDNGVIGACTLPAAEERRCRLLKEAGFNCIRSAHHPMSKAMLDACDRLGMLVMDELFDMWEKPKTLNDYALFFSDDWENVTERMIAKDYNHPCVILYSTGNEILEVGTPKGAELHRSICEKIRSMDKTRYITNGFNGYMASVDYKREIDAALKKKKEAEMREINDMMGLQNNGGEESNIQDTFQHPIMTRKIDEFMAPLDVAGFNYITARHVMDRDTKPNRVIVGSETFPAEIAQLWEIVKKNRHVIGDMTWTGYDYLGETGVGLVGYEGVSNEGVVYRTSAAGDIDLIGRGRSLSYYRQIVFGLRKEPYLAVERPEHFGQKQLKSGWAFADNLDSWTWAGFEGEPIEVTVYGDGEEAELFINGASQGRRAIGADGDFTVKFQVTYEPGEIYAVLYRGGESCRSNVLQTAQTGEQLSVEADRSSLKADGQDAAFLTVCVKDKCGVVNLQERKEIHVEIEGPGVLQGFGSADPAETASYQSPVSRTFDGYAQAVVRSVRAAGEIKVTFTAEGCEPCQVALAAEFSGSLDGRRIP